MKKIKVLQHSNQLGLGGTEKTMQLFCKYLDKEKFEVHALAPRYPVPPHRVWLDRLRALLGSSRAKDRNQRTALLHARLPLFEEILGKENVHLYTLGALPGIIQQIRPDILHLHHSGESEPPLSHPAVDGIPLIFSTNVFGLKAREPEQRKLSKILFISKWLKQDYAKWSSGDRRCDVLYYPIEKPCSQENLRRELHIQDNCFVVGRVGRNADDIHDPISLKAYKEIEDQNTVFLALSPPKRMVQDAQDLGIRNIRFLEPTVNDVLLSKFYNTMDVMAHARLDGETFGCTIAEAMIHGRPVVTHRSDQRNAQVELVELGTGFVAEQNDWKKYAEYLGLLKKNKNLRLVMGESARKRALENFEAGVVTKKLEQMYRQGLGVRGWGLGVGGWGLGVGGWGLAKGTWPPKL